MLRRRRWVGMAALGLAGLLAAAGYVGSRGPAPTAEERRLLGRWATPQDDPRIGYVTARGPVTHPVRVWEFHRDHTFTRGIASADDPRLAFVNGEGVWSMAGGKLRIEGFGAAGDAVREARERVLGRFVRPYVARPSGAGVVHAVRFDDADTWTLTTDLGYTTTWKRRP